jgi:hypothetical protein
MKESDTIIVQKRKSNMLDGSTPTNKEWNDE